MPFYEDRRMEYQLVLPTYGPRPGTVHAAMRKVIAETGEAPWRHFTLCGAASSDITMVKTANDVTCKRCLKKLTAGKEEPSDPALGRRQSLTMDEPFNDWRERRRTILEGPGGQLQAFPTEENELAVYVHETPTEQVWVRTGHCWRTYVTCPLPPRLVREMAYSLREQADMADAASGPWQGDPRRFGLGAQGLSDLNRVVVYGQLRAGAAPGAARVVVEVIDENMKDPAERVTYAHMDTATARRCADALDEAADAAEALALLGPARERRA